MTSITDTCLIVATVAGPVLAVQTQKFIERATERSRAQRGIFNTLMATRAARVSAAHVEALNAIDLHFRKNGWRSPSIKEREVSRRWRIYADHLNTDLDGSSDAQVTAWNVNRDEYFHDLLEAMAKALGYNFDRIELKRGIYSPKAHGDAEVRQRQMEHGILDILAGRASLPMKVTDFPISEEALALQMEYQRAMLEAIRGGRLELRVVPPIPAPFADAAE
jgi:hypothetical protein